jgi:ElaB/YqjD/DUF883 family membrane-anchored ribosome-binding protein
MANNGHKNVEKNVEAFKDEVSKELRELGREARHKADSAKKDVVGKLYEAAESIRREVRDAKAGNDATESADKFAHGLEKAAHYLNRHSFDDMGEDVERAVKRNPMPMLLVVLLIGVVLGLILRGDGKQA